ncbi:MAG: xanthine dehydrogenase family protein molybdopterin-binding subunit [Phycisphaerae bacterium]|nr:xanthine dehydrogenase family protein molybdopterin-binding subunit [Phycisphaerae bacterium]
MEPDSGMSVGGKPLVEASTTPYREVPKGAVGRSDQRVDGVEKVTGTALYGADLFFNRADYFAQVVRSEEAHAKIIDIDATAALKVPGVLAVYTAADATGTNRQGLILRDHPVLAEDKVLYRGDAIAIAVGRTEAAARRGRDVVRVRYEPLPVVGGIDDALAADAPRLHPNGNIMGGKRIRKGDACAALAGKLPESPCDVIVSETFQTQTVDHAFLDLEAGIAVWDGTLLTIHASGQWAHEERRLVALALGLPIEAVRIVTPVTGGAFGGREDLSIQVYLGMVALKHPGKTIAMRYSREESMRARHKRHAVRVHYTMGASRDGTLSAAKVTVFSDEGAYASTGPAVMRKASSHATGPFRVPHVYVDVYGVFTNNNPTGAMRGFGACQMAIAYNGVLDRLAARLRMDPVELRRKNLVRPGDEVTTGQVLPAATAVECMDAALERFWGEETAKRRNVKTSKRRNVETSKRRNVETSEPTDVAESLHQPCAEAPPGQGRGLLGEVNAPSSQGRGLLGQGRLPVDDEDTALAPHLRRGWGISNICFGLGYGDGFPDASRARVKFEDDGRLCVYTGGVEYGQGLVNVVSQIAAEELGLPLARVDVVWGDTGRTLESGSTSATRQTYFTGNAVRIAASELREQVLDIAGKMLHVHPHELELADRKVAGRFDSSLVLPIEEAVEAGRKRGHSLEGSGIFKPRTVCEDFDTGQSPRAFVTYLFASHVAQVLVDTETGEVRVERYVACHDVGKAINPHGVMGQVAGGAAQGIGMALMEEVVMDRGRMMNPNFTDYILPTICDVPEIEYVILENDDPGGPFGARGLGEPTLIASTPAVLSAIGDAIGVAPYTTPCTPQRIWELLHPESANVPPEARMATAPAHARMSR